MQFKQRAEIADRVTSKLRESTAEIHELEREKLHREKERHLAALATVKADVSRCEKKIEIVKQLDALQKRARLPMLSATDDKAR